jgi:predicted enzyme related to lactoylglutathione lyase
VITGGRHDELFWTTKVFFVRLRVLRDFVVKVVLFAVCRLGLSHFLAAVRQGCGAAETAGISQESDVRIKLTTIYVDDQDKALLFYTDVLGFAKKADSSQAPYRWLTLVSIEEPDGTELQLERTGDPAAKAFQQSKFQQGQPAAMFFTDDVQRDYDRMKAAGAEFTTPPTKVTGSTIAMVNDTCGNLIQLTQLTWGS